MLRLALLVTRATGRAGQIFIERHDPSPAAGTVGAIILALYRACIATACWHLLECISGHQRRERRLEGRQVPPKSALLGRDKAPQPSYLNKQYARCVNTPLNRGYSANEPDLRTALPPLPSPSSFLSSSRSSPAAPPTNGEGIAAARGPARARRSAAAAERAPRQPRPASASPNNVT